jgi:hypothetical protein
MVHVIAIATFDLAETIVIGKWRIPRRIKKPHGRPQLWQHIGNVLTAMQGAAEVLELDGRLAA